MQRTYGTSYIIRYTVLGVGLGLLLVCLATLLQLFSSKSGFNWGFIVQIHSDYPAMYLLDILPLIGGGTFFFLALKTSQRNRLYLETDTAHSQHTEELYRLIKSIRSGERVEFTPSEQDTLGNALLGLRNDLEESRQEEASRRRDDELRSWTAEGLAKFGEILRTETERLEELAYQIVQTLVKYIGANQCGFYLLEEEDPNDRHFRLMACYAYDRRKFADQRVEWGDGLIGACAREGVTTLIDDLPDGYLRITSGLGDATPKNLMLVPIVQEGTVFGVLEIASFTPFESYVVEFTERVAGTVAATLSGKRISIRTAQLLAESRKQAETLVAQEEQMRQNMEELQATQEEAARQAESFVSFTNSVNQTLIRAEYSVEGILLYANSKFLQKLEYNSKKEVEGKHISLFINSKDRASFEEMWSELIRGGRHIEGDMKLLTRSGKDLWTIAAYTCVRNQDDEVERVLFLAIDTTHDKIRNLDWQGQMDALNRVSIKVELTPLGDIIDVNEQFSLTLGYSKQSILRKPFLDLLPKNVQNQFERTLEQVCQGEDYEGPLHAATPEGEDRWLRISLTTVNDMYGDISKVILIGNDITREQIMEMESRRQTEQLKRQEEQLRQNEVELNKKLRQAREEVKNQFREIEKVQIRNEKTLEGFLDAIITSDQDGVVEFFNRAAEELFAIDRSEVLGQNIRLLFPEETVGDNAFLKGYLDPHGEKIIGERREVNIVAANGEELSVLMLLSEAKIGRKTSYTAFVQNISLDLF